MKDGSEFKPSLSFGLLLKGQPKAGKTTLALMFPNPYIADCDNNLGGAVRLLREKFPDKKFKYDTINAGVDAEGKPIPDIGRWAHLCACCTAAARDPWVQTIIVDSVTAVNMYLTDLIVSEKPASKEKFMTISDWVPFRNMIVKFITTFRSVNKYFIMTAHEVSDKDEATGTIYFRPSVQSNLKDNFGGMFSDEWLACAEEQSGQIVRFVKSTPEPRRSMGSMLDLPVGPWTFTWDKFAERLKKFDETIKAK